MTKKRAERATLIAALALAATLAAVLLNGCATHPAQEEARLLAPVQGPPLQEADALLAQGRAGEAARAYLGIAERVGPPAREQLQIKAVKAHLASGDTRAAQEVISKIERQQLTPGQRTLLTLSEADLALLEGRAEDAIKRLDALQPATLANELNIQRLASLASAQRLNQDPVASAQSLIALDRLLDEEARLLNQVSLIATLSTLSSETLKELARSGQGAMKGWADLALIAHQSGGDPTRFQELHRQSRSGRALAGEHPRLAQAYAEMLSGGYAKGDRVSLILPGAGRFAAAAVAIKEGLEAARRADVSGQPPTLETIDNSNPERTVSLHAGAVERGARYVIGPLQKDSVDRLAATTGLSVPTLALNQSTRSDRTPNLFQFALAPENEASEAATKAAASGLQRAFILYPEGAWGNRLASAFREQWRRRGGSLVGEASYDPTSTDTLRTPDAELQRNEAQVLFLVATQELAHQLYPRIRSAAPGMAVISTSHVYSGAYDISKDRALTGLYFVDIPWMLEQIGDGPLSRRRLSGASFEVANPLARLYAMGIDAYRITPRLSGLAQNPGALYPGQTGGLSIDSLGRIQRQLALGRFTDKGVEPVETLSTSAATSSAQ